MARKSFSKFQQTEILGNQGYECNTCNVKFSKTVHPQFDHINGINEDNRTENGQAICSNCHDAKSRKENAKRSQIKKNIDFVRYCPLCDKELKGKDFLDDHGNKLTTKYLPADDWITCPGCESQYKVLRHDSKTRKKLPTKKHADSVKCCVHCRTELRDHSDNRPSSNTYMQCAECRSLQT